MRLNRVHQRFMFCVENVMKNLSHHVGGDATVTLGSLCNLGDRFSELPTGRKDNKKRYNKAYHANWFFNFNPFDYSFCIRLVSYRCFF